MTNGLLTSRRTKIELLKKSLIDPSDANKKRFKTYKNMYNKLLRVAKTNNIQERLQKNQKKTKKNMGNLEGAHWQKKG
jgi:hypothetical protein